MTNLDSILNAADRASVIEANFERLDPLLDAPAPPTPGPDDNTRYKDGQFQIWDSVAALADPTKPWRALTAEGGVLGLSDPILDASTGSDEPDNTRYKDGQFQIWDSVAALADPTKPWRALTAEGGVLGLTAPITD